MLYTVACVSADLLVSCQLVIDSFESFKQTSSQILWALSHDGNLVHLF